MREVLPDLARLMAAGATVAVATVVSTRGSAPRPTGAKMLVADTGEIFGSVSGGCVESAVAEYAEAVLNGADPALLSFGISDDLASEAGLPCGGEIDVWVQRHVDTAFTRPMPADQRLVEVTLLEGARAGSKLVVDAAGPIDGTLGSSARDHEAAVAAGRLIWQEASTRVGDLFFDVSVPGPRLIMFGAPDIANSVCRLARECGWRPFVVDPRARFATASRFPDAEQVVVAWPDAALRDLGGLDPATYVVVLSHDPKIDDAALMIALRSPTRFVGAMGSWRAQQSRRERLLEAGLTETELDRLVAPLGLDLGANEREETALSMFAEIVASRHGRSGGPLHQSTRRIHEQPS